MDEDKLSPEAEKLFEAILDDYFDGREYVKCVDCETVMEASDPDEADAENSLCVTVILSEHKVLVRCNRCCDCEGETENHVTQVNEPS